MELEIEEHPALRPKGCHRGRAGGRVQLRADLEPPDHPGEPPGHRLRLCEGRSIQGHDEAVAGIHRGHLLSFLCRGAKLRPRLSCQEGGVNAPICLINNVTERRSDASKPCYRTEEASWAREASTNTPHPCLPAISSPPARRRGACSPSFAASPG